jgi:glutathione S-transferase
MDHLLALSDWLAGFSFADIAFYMAALFGERQSVPLTSRTPHPARVAHVRRNACR